LKFFLSQRSFLLPPLILLALAGGPSSAWAQGGESGVREAFFRAVGEHFGVEVEEVGIIGEWDLAPDEVPVVLFLAQKAGVSPDALIGLRRGGRLWQEVAGRFGIEPRDFHLPLPGGVGLGPLAAAYEQFRGTPPQEWSGIRLEDGDVVALVNLRVLSEQTGVPPLTVLTLYTEAGSFMAAYSLLLGH
jgi:hypothetical protein